MIFCLNPDCVNPYNPDFANFCLSCGTGLVPLLRSRYRVLSLLPVAACKHHDSWLKLWVFRDFDDDGMGDSR